MKSHEFLWSLPVTIMCSPFGNFDMITGTENDPYCSDVMSIPSSGLQAFDSALLRRDLIFIKCHLHHSLFLIWTIFPILRKFLIWQICPSTVDCSVWTANSKLSQNCIHFDGSALNVSSQNFDDLQSTFVFWIPVSPVYVHGCNAWSLFDSVSGSRRIKL